LLFIAPFTYIYSIFIKDFKIFVGSEVGILVLDLNSYKIQNQYITNSKVDFIAYNGNWIYYFSENSIYKIALNWQFGQSPFLIKQNVQKPKKFGISEDYKIILDYGNYKKIFNDAGFEENNFSGEVYWSSFDTLNFPHKTLWNFKKGYINVNFSYEYGDYNFIGTEGLGLRIYYRNSLNMKDSITIGTFNKIYKSVYIKDNKIYVLGDKGVDIIDENLNSSDFIKIDVCSNEAEIIENYVFCKNNIYRIDEGQLFAVMKAINFNKVKKLKDNFYILTNEGVFKFDGQNLEKIYNDLVYDVYLKNDSLVFLKKYDKFVKVIDSLNYLCSRYGIENLNNNEVYNVNLGNVNDCVFYNNEIFVASNNGLFRVSLEKKEFYPYPNIRNVKKILIFKNHLIALTERIIYLIKI